MKVVFCFSITDAEHLLYLLLLPGPGKLFYPTDFDALEIKIVRWVEF